MLLIGAFPNTLHFSEPTHAGLGAGDVFQCRRAFHCREDLDQEEKAKFGELCSGENGKGREWFARYVSAQVRERGYLVLGGRAVAKIGCCSTAAFCCADDVSITISGRLSLGESSPN